ncbi:thiamine diphosphate-binding protein [Pelagophyceae sp. CCMP2097]|nr:thiamine diphosphate-binding protein [Pelagophyceae sp. CCMP2097]
MLIRQLARAARVGGGVSVFPRRAFFASPTLRDLLPVVVPSLGDSITEATIVSLERAIGESVKADDVIAVLETDKVSVEVFAPFGGVVKAINVNVDDTVIVGASIITIDTDATGGAAPAPEAPVVAAAPAVKAAPAGAVAAAAARPAAVPPAASLAGSGDLSFLSGTSSAYVDAMFEAWSERPAAVHASWDAYFRSGTFALPPALGGAAAYASAAAAPADSLPGIYGADTARALHLIAAYQRRGHEHADLDPLKLLPRKDLSELDPATYGFSAADYDRELQLYTPNDSAVAGLLGSADVNRDGLTTLGELVDFLEQTYCGTIGIEAEHITDLEKLNWLRSRLEVLPTPLAREERLHVLKELACSEKFEAVLATKFNTAKRFGLEGCEAMIPGLKTMVDEATKFGVTDVILGMPHRGRLNVLCNVVGKPIEVIFREFMGTEQAQALAEEQGRAADWSSSGDVKYHLGTSIDRAYPDGRRVQIELLPNPSHLEAVDPLVLGKARARMDMKGDAHGDTVLPVIIHGDAAFAGQGIVYEVMQMVDLAAYKSGGCMHVICNNQVGFTASMAEGRSTMYASDLGKAFGCPIFHVNADDPEAVCRVFKLAVAWRQRFKTDVLIDLIGYRKFGHNEIDEPTFTQPVMYQSVQKHPTPLNKYLADIAVTEPKIPAAEAMAVVSEVEAIFSAAFDNREAFKWKRDVWGQNWGKIVAPYLVGAGAYGKTGVSADLLSHVGAALHRLPEKFNVHRRLKPRLAQFSASLETGTDITWPMAEQLAFGTLLMEGIGVRFTGQDVERGTFTHRHAVVSDQETGEKHTFLNHIAADQPASLYIANSFLSEYGVLGFELGYSFETPDVLVVWEAQFGDFVNGAQIVIDQFISSGEAKWMRQSGLVMLLPHGYQGQGPEHSSCRIERFLQCSDEDPDVIPKNLGTLEGQTRQVQLNNWQIINPTTPANYFHALRRQQHRDFRKPLIVASTKALLRHKLAVSTATEFQTGSRFRRTYGEMFDDEVVAAEEMRRIVLCSGKIYYELLEARRAAGVRDVALVRIEQLSPFPFDQVANYASQYVNAEIVWAQEEPKNMGAWYFVRDRIMTATRVLNHQEQRPGYCGRNTMASTAEGYGAVHDSQQKKIIDTALGDSVTAVPFGRI